MKAEIKNRLEEEIGFRVPDDLLKSLHKRFLDEYGVHLPDGSRPLDRIEDIEETFVQYCLPFLEGYEIGIKRNGKHLAPAKTRNTTRKGIIYGKSFEGRYSLYMFVESQKHCKPAFARLMNEKSDPNELTWERLYANYRISNDPSTGRPYSHVPPNVSAFKQEYWRANQEFGGLTSEDESGLSAIMLENAMSFKPGQDRNQTLAAAFEVIRKKRLVESQDGAGQISRWSVYRFAEGLIEGFANAE